MKDSMTPRERWLTVLEHGKPDRIPLDYRATDETTAKLLRHLGVADEWAMYERLHIDPVVEVQARYVGPPIEPDSDVYGIGYVDMDYGTGSYREPVFHPLAEYGSPEEIEHHYRWPSPDWYDYSGITAQLVGREQCVVRAGHYEPFAYYKWLRGVEQGYLDLLEHPDIVHYCLDRLLAFHLEQIGRIYEQIPGQAIWTWVADDFGSQEGLLIAPTLIHEFFIPRMKRMIDLVHQAGAYAFFHSDGAVRRIMPDMIAIGINVLDPVQWRAKGMDRAALKRDFGDRLVFHGAMDNQYTMAFGTLDEVRAEAADNIRLLGNDGGYILGPCHNLQPIGSAESIVAMYDAAYEASWLA